MRETLTHFCAELDGQAESEVDGVVIEADEAFAAVCGDAARESRERDRTAVPEVLSDGFAEVHPPEAASATAGQRRRARAVRMAARYTR